MEGIAIGIIKECWNEKVPGRVKVEYTVGESGKTMTGWIPSVPSYAGAGYGAYILPRLEQKLS